MHRFRSLLAHLATQTCSLIRPRGDLPTFAQLAHPTPVQRKAYELAGLPQPP